MLEKRELDQNGFIWRISATVAFTSGIFSIIVFTLLMVNYVQMRIDNPAGNEMLRESRALYAAQPERDQGLANRIQHPGLMPRNAIFTSQTHLNMGGTLLLIGVCVFLISLKTMSRRASAPPELAEKPQAEIAWGAIQISRPYLARLGVLVLICGLGAAYLGQLKMGALARGELLLAKAEAAEEEAGPLEEIAVPVFPDWDAMQTQWPSFRGPGALGVAHFTTAPVTWDVEAGQGVRWKAELPLEGSNSPVVWENKLFLSGASEEEREVYCFDTESGELLWTHALKRFPGTPAKMPDVTEETSFAPSTLAVHGNRVFALFPNGDIVSCDLEGNQVWGKNLGVPDNHYGHSSSLLAYGELVYVQYDDNEMPRLIALNAIDGSEAWATERNVISWASPSLAKTDLGMQLLLASSEDAAGYDPISGKQLWLQECLGGEVGASPAFGAGMVFVANEYAVASAIKLTKDGDAITPEIVWEYDYLLPEVASPVSDGKNFYIATSVGELVCLRAEDGKELWAEELGYGFYSSPILVGNRIYAADLDGTMFIVRAGAEYELIAELPLGAATLTTPAFLDGRMYVRTAEHLLCIERVNSANK